MRSRREGARGDRSHKAKAKSVSGLALLAQGKQMVKHKKRNREMVTKAAEAIGCNKMTMLGLLPLSQLTYESCEVPSMDHT